MKIQDPSDHRHVRNERDRKKEYIDSYRDIFYKGSKRCRRIYVCGDAGMGKSSLCEWMVHLWCQVQAQHDSSSRSQDEKVIAEFPLLFCISLRDSWADRKCLGQDEVEEMIKIQLELKKYDIARLLETENCLIILDGLDEWMPQKQRVSTRKDSKDLPIQHALGGFTVLTTSRPWKMEILRSELEGRVDKLISISGLGPSSTDKLANNVINLLNKEYSRDKKKRDFMKIIEQKNLDHFINVPVLLMQLVCLWHDGVEFGQSECDIYSNMIARLLQYAEKEKDLPELGEGVMSNVLLPTCLEKNKVFLRHRHLLHSLSKLAFHTFFSANMETSLVFDHEETHIYGMTPVELESCLKIGLLSQKVCSEEKAITKEYKSISFMHKTHQEFFSAIYLSTKAETSDIYETFSQAVSSLDRAIEFEKVLLFVCGMNPDMGTRLSEKIMETVSRDKRIEDYRVSCIDKWYLIPYRPFVEEIQKMILKGLEEAMDNEMEGCRLRMDDIIAVWIVDWDGPSSDSSGPQLATNSNLSTSLIARNLHNLNVSQAKSLMVVTPRLTVPKNNRKELDQLLDWFQHLQNLEKIHIYDMGYPRIISLDKVLSIIGPSKHTLRSLVLIKLDFQALGNHFSEIFPDIKKLESFSLEKCVLLHEQLEMLSEFLCKSSKLKQLKLNEIRCKAHSGGELEHGVSDCTFTLDLSGCSLEQLYLGKLYLKDLKVATRQLIRCDLNLLDNERKTRDLLESLTAARSLQILFFRGRQLKVGEILAKVIPELSSIQLLTLKDIDFGEHVVSFSSNMDDLTQVKLLEGHVSDACLKSMVDSLPPHPIDVHIQNTEITDLPGWRQQNTLQYIRESPQFVVTCDPDDDWTSESTTSTMFFYTQH